MDFASPEVMDRPSPEDTDFLDPEDMGFDAPEDIDPGEAETMLGGEAEAVGLGESSIDSGAGDDFIEITAEAHGNTTHAWAVRASDINTGDGSDVVNLNAITNSGEFDPAYGATNSTIKLGRSNDVLNINASASGTADGLIAAYGSIDSVIDGGNGNDSIVINAFAENLGKGESDVAGLLKSVIHTRKGKDYVSIEGGAINSSIYTGSGRDKVEIKGNNTSNLGINTGSGRDRIKITQAQDISLTTGSGSDLIIFNTDLNNDLVTEKMMNSHLTVTDFKPGKRGDQLNFNNLINDHEPDHLGAIPFPNSHISLAQNGTDTIISFDADGITGEGSSVVISTLQNVDMSELVARNFVSNRRSNRRSKQRQNRGFDPITGQGHDRITDREKSSEPFTSRPIPRDSSEAIEMQPMTNSMSSQADSFGSRHLLTTPGPLEGPEQPFQGSEAGFLG